MREVQTALVTGLHWVKAALFGCLHLRQSWPMHNSQGCLDCGAKRFYILGQEPGPWKHL
jgi:hypothetical protein